MIFLPLDTEYDMAPEPSAEDWRIRSVFLEQRRSVPKAAFELGIERAEVVRAVMACRDWLKDSGWEAAYAEAKRVGMGDADARLRADLVAARICRICANTKARTPESREKANGRRRGNPAYRAQENASRRGNREHHDRNNARRRTPEWRAKERAYRARRKAAAAEGAE